MDRFCAKELVGEIIERLTSETELEDTRDHLRTLLLQFAADEVQLKDDMVDAIFAACFKYNTQSSPSDSKITHQLLEGRYRNKLIDCFSEIDKKYHNGYMHNKSIPLILLGEIANPYQYYIEHRLSDSLQQQVEALAVLATGLWINESNTLQQADVAQLKAELFGFLELDNQHIRTEAFDALNRIPLNTAEGISCYMEACIKYINDFHQILPSWNWLLWIRWTKDFEIETQVCISEEALQWICADLRDKTPIIFDTYKNLLVLALLSRNCMIIDDLLGHYDAGFTLRTYTHATRQMQNQAAETMGSFMSQVM